MSSGIESDTIVALSTPSAESAIGVVRLSGSLCESLAEACFGKSRIEPRRLYRGFYKACDGSVLDDAVFAFYKAPASYTGQDMLEISCHGSPYILRSVISDLIARGCRGADAGEFTRRAFLNDKMDLSQAEAVALTIGARSARALAAAQKQLSGELGKRVNAFCERLIDACALAEAYIDFPEDDLPPEDTKKILADIEALGADFEKLIKTAKYSSLIHGGINVAIAGAPNAGKSSLLNALLGSRRAIVSEIAGTTRDFISEKLAVGSYAINILDTAGLRETADKIETMGIELSMEKILQADLRLFAIDSSSSAPRVPQNLAGLLTHKNTIVVINKTDLPQAENFENFLPQCPRVKISCLKESGLDDLRAAIISMIETHHISASADDILVGARHAKSLESALENLRAAAQKLIKGAPAELLASDLKSALACVGEIVGKVDNEKILDKIFSTFCIGK